MLYLSFDDVKIPLTCINGLSYSKAGKIVNTSRLACRCNGIEPLQVQIQMSFSKANCLEDDFTTIARAITNKRPSKATAPSSISVGDDIIIPQLKFMLISTNISYQSDRLGGLQEINVSWTLAGSRVVKDENRNTELKTKDTSTLMPKVTLHCKGKSIDCAQDISIADLRLSGFKGNIQLVLADTYTEIDRDSWLADVNDDKDSYFEIENYGKYYILESSIIADNWLTFNLTKFSKEWYKKRTETFISNQKPFTLADVFTDATIKTKALIEYLKFDDTSINVLYVLQNNLGYNIGLRNDQIVLYNTPDIIANGNVTYDYVLDNDLMTAPITKVILRDGYGEYVAGDNDGETYFVQTICRLADGDSTAENVLKYVQFQQNMFVLTIPLESRINIGSIINVNLGDKIIHCVCTEFDADFIDNSMRLELHYVDR